MLHHLLVKTRDFEERKPRGSNVSLPRGSKVSLPQISCVVFAQATIFELQLPNV